MDNVWTRLLEVLKDKTNEQNFNLWFKPIKLLGVDETTWSVMVPNGFFRDWINDHYIDVIEKTLFDLTSQKCELKILVDDENGEELSVKQSKPKTPRIRKVKKPDLGLCLNPRFIFSNFVIGNSNDFAHAACKAVAKNPGKSYNPLFIYGGTGLGKTHLLQAIGHEATRIDPSLRVAYITSERFTSDMINSIATNNMSDFKRRYRDLCDILLMDDIQFIAGKSSTQEEFFHTFNFLFDSGKQIVVTSDKYPQEIKTLDERIRSRLQSGLVADIKVPDLETRTAILKKKADRDNFQVDHEVLSFIAKNVKSNVREMEGSLIRLEAYASLTGSVIDLSKAKDVLKDFLQNLPIELSADKIQKKVCNYYKISSSEIKSKSRTRKLVLPRQIAMYLIKKYTDLSLAEIGANFGGKDHSTVISSIHKIERDMVEDMNLRNSIEAIEKQLEV